MMQVMFKRPDGSFVAEINGNPYHVIPSDPLFAEAQEAGADAPFEPVPPQPTEAELLAAWRATAKVSRFQARAALFAAGKLAAVEAVVAATGGMAAIAWADASEFRRDSPTIAALAGAAGLTDTDLDALFQAAAQITA